MPLLERKPRAVFNAKPVRQVVQKELEWGMKFPDANKDTATNNKPREMNDKS